MGMLIEEIISSVEVIRDPYLRAVTYAKIGEKLVLIKDEHFKIAFSKALETADGVDDPVTMLKSLLAVGYSLKRVGVKSANRIFQQVLEDSKVLSPADRDSLMHTAATYLATAGDIGGAVIFATEIQKPELKNSTLLEVIKRSTAFMGGEQIKIAYKLRKIKLALESITLEPYRSKAFIELIKIHLNLGSHEKAINLIEEIKGKEWAKLAFKEVVFHLKDKNILHRYIPLLESLAERLSKKFGDEFLVEMARAFALSGAVEAAVSLLRKSKGNSRGFSEIAITLIEKNIEVLPEFIDALSSEEAGTAGKELMNYLLDHPEKGTPEIISAIKKKSPSEEILVKLVRYHLLKSNLESAREIAVQIKDERLRSVALADIAHSFLKKNRLAEAIDAALEVRDPKFSSVLVSEILLKALDDNIKTGRWQDEVVQTADQEKKEK